MRIEKLAVKNFRLLKDVHLCLEERTTVIVGRNNSGKTSLTELFRRLLQEKSPSFHLEDFSLCAHQDFWTAFVQKANGADESEIRQVLPVIEVTLTISYNTASPSLGALCEFVVDLNSDCAQVVIAIRYELKRGEIKRLFADLSYNVDADENAKLAFFREMKARVPKLYRVQLHAVDPHRPENIRSMEWTSLQGLLQSGFINAQRGLDDTTHRSNEVLGNILESLFTTARSQLEDTRDRDAARALDDVVRNVQEQLDANFNRQFEALLPTFSLFGYPGLVDPKLRTETTLDVTRLLTNHTKVRYAGVHGVTLPEAYNGLGSRNLIFILLKLLDFFKSFKAQHTTPGIHLVFIEEPEAHLHPQMAEVFIRKLHEIAAEFANGFNDGVHWPVQFVVTTHSTHMANEADLDSIRYFLAISDIHTNYCKTTIKDFRQGLGDCTESDRQFLHQYMTLTRCDLLFADKAVLIEGTSERLLLPVMINKIDATPNANAKLSSQYLSVIEVGGAYAHIFFALLRFLELKTLIITDLDSAAYNPAKRLAAEKVSTSTHTTNACIKQWFENDGVSPANLIAKGSADKTKGLLQLAYQVPEVPDSPCGRSFEGAFMLANRQLFGLDNVPDDELEDRVWENAPEDKKSDFALMYAIQVTNWNVPRYIEQGLRWLADDSPRVATAAATASLDSLPTSKPAVDPQVPSG
jgi:putative ATP-dependent endonuclease of OLD family